MITMRDRRLPNGKHLVTIRRNGKHVDSYVVDTMTIVKKMRREHKLANKRELTNDYGGGRIEHEADVNPGLGSGLL